MIEPRLLSDLEQYQSDLARVQADIRLLQQQMGITPQTLEQRARAHSDRIALEQQATQRARPSWMNNPNG
jgi:methylphosphotriester-DNA--protein-cysteine methyltransferase